jgi:hypothetical protein
MSSECAIGVFLRDGVHVYRGACLDSIALETLLGSDTPAVMYSIPLQNLIKIGGRLRWEMQLHEADFVLYLNHCYEGERMEG